MLNRKILIDSIGLLSIALVVVVGYKLSPLLLPRADVVVQADPGCDLQRSACSVALPAGGQMTLDLGSRPVPLVKPFKFEVRLQDATVDRVDIDFAGVEMNMGLNRSPLTAVTSQRFVGEATLPVCITGRMEWQATVLMAQGGQRIAVPFRFMTGEHGS